MVSGAGLQGAGSRYLRAVMILLVILMSLGAGLLASRQLLPLALGAASLGISALVFLRWPPVGLLTLIAVSFILPVKFGTGTATQINLTVIASIVIVGLLAVQFAADRTKPSGKAARFVLAPMLLFVGLAILSFLFGQLPWFRVEPAPMIAQLGQLTVFISLPGLVMFMDRNVGDEKWLRWMTWTFLGFGTFRFLLSFFPSLQEALSFLFHEGASGSLFWIWLIALSAGQALFNKDLRLIWRLALGLIGLSALGYGLFINYTWASGWFPPLIALLVMVIVAWPRLAIPLALTLTALGFLYADEALQFLLINEEYSIVTRLEAWRLVTDMVVGGNPLLGFGPANYRFYTVLEPILGWTVQYNSHNQYVDLLAQLGVLGLSMFLWFAGAMGVLLWRLRKRLQFSGFLTAYCYTAIGSLVGMLASGMLADWVLPYVYNITLSGMRSSAIGWAFLGGALSLNRIVQSRQRKTSEAWPTPSGAPLE